MPFRQQRVTRPKRGPPSRDLAEFFELRLGDPQPRPRAEPPTRPGLRLDPQGPIEIFPAPTQLQANRHRRCPGRFPFHFKRESRSLAWIGSKLLLISVPLEETRGPRGLALRIQVEREHLQNVSRRGLRTLCHGKTDKGESEQQQSNHGGRVRTNRENATLLLRWAPTRNFKPRISRMTRMTRIMNQAPEPRVSTEAPLSPLSVFAIPIRAIRAIRGQIPPSRVCYGNASRKKRLEFPLLARATDFAPLKTSGALVTRVHCMGNNESLSSS